MQQVAEDPGPGVVGGEGGGGTVGRPPHVDVDRGAVRDPLDGVRQETGPADPAPGRVPQFEDAERLPTEVDLDGVDREHLGVVGAAAVHRVGTVGDRDARRRCRGVRVR
ncbi:hypothetical protein O7608_20215 [Solwaraspora sp. WMMA2056]|uniref:hypothetical protein n=1 Tax=Solwaraspora sp. WMMA2056 TaxID=3015161 RepID=UPI00259BA743|nr:hypothetical protein [Solwaraspora sp. WMMA2056]WJK38816.1 hypothetical protein O7608_20215 [Solwaraspora sp. WMMA2056]